MERPTGVLRNKNKSSPPPPKKKNILRKPKGHQTNNTSLQPCKRTRSRGLHLLRQRAAAPQGVEGSGGLEADAEGPPPGLLAGDGDGRQAQLPSLPLLRIWTLDFGLRNWSGVGSFREQDRSRDRFVWSWHQDCPEPCEGPVACLLWVLGPVRSEIAGQEGNMPGVPPLESLHMTDAGLATGVAIGQKGTEWRCSFWSLLEA